MLGQEAISVVLTPLIIGAQGVLGIVTIILMER
jgi:hypothetical protein